MVKKIGDMSGGRDSLDLSRIPKQRPAAAPASQSRSVATDGRNAVALTPVPKDPLEKGRGSVPMAPPPPPPPPKPPAPIKKK